MHTFAMDVTDDASMVGGIERIVAERGRIDVLVNNAGYGSYGAVEDVPIDEARRQFEVNLFGLARLVQLVTPHMREQKTGRIINISSVGAVIYEPFGRGTTRPSSRWTGSATACGWSCGRSGSTWCSCTRPGSSPSGTRSPATSLVETQQGRRVRRQRGQGGKAMESVDNPRLSSGPEVVAKTIVKAATARRPRSLRDRQGREHRDDDPAVAAGPGLRRS